MFTSSGRPISNGGGSGNGTSSQSYNGNNNSGDNQGTRETGIIEKLLVRNLKKRLK